MVLLLSFGITVFELVYVHIQYEEKGFSLNSKCIVVVKICLGESSLGTVLMGVGIRLIRSISLGYV